MRLARSIGLIVSVDLAEGIETIRQMAPEVIPGTVIISLRD